VPVTGRKEEEGKIVMRASVGLEIRNGEKKGKKYKTRLVNLEYQQCSRKTDGGRRERSLPGTEEYRGVTRLTSPRVV